MNYLLVATTRHYFTDKWLVFIAASRVARLTCADEGTSVSRRVTFQLKGASRGPLYLGLPFDKLRDQPKANIIRSASADRLKGTNYGYWDKR